MQCLTNIIGLSRTENECFPAPTSPSTIDTATSLSGLFIDELEGLKLKIINAGEDCANQKIWEMMNRARANAIHELRTAIMKGLYARYKRSREPYFGLLGADEFTTNLSPFSAGVVSVPVYTYNLPGESIFIKEIGLLFSQEVTVDISIYRASRIHGNLSTMPVLVRTIEAVPSKINKPEYMVLEEPIELPCDGSAYYFRYDYDGTYLIRDNFLSCGCKTKDIYLKKFIDNSRYDSAKGISMKVQITCDLEALICDNVEQKPVILDSMAYATRFKAAQMLIADIVHSTEINRYTMLGMEQLQANSFAFEEKFMEHVEWMTGPDGINVELNSCFSCKTSTGRIKQHIT